MNPHPLSYCADWHEQRAELLQIFVNEFQQEGRTKRTTAGEALYLGVATAEVEQHTKWASQIRELIKDLEK